MATGLTKATNGNWYYFNGSGIRQYGWVKFGSKYRYFQSNGVMLANCTKKISGKNYKFNSSGICTNK
jgi:glucan-binding YG repeat protein